MCASGTDALGQDSALPLPAPSIGHAADTLPVREIVIVGNTRTREEVVRMFLRLDTGAVYDSTALAVARLRLMNTRVFFSVNILRVPKQDGISIYVMLKELPRYTLTDIGGVLYTQIYGDTAVSFWRLCRGLVTLRVGNVGGTLGALSFAVSFWEFRHASVTWYKPLLPSPYYLMLSGGWLSYPNEARPWRRNMAHASVGTGRRLDFADSRVFASLSPQYNKATYEGPTYAGRLSQTILADTALSDSRVVHSIAARDDDSVWSDTVRLSDTTVEITRWRGSGNWEADQRTKEFVDIYTSCGYVYNNVDENYPHLTGFYALGALGMNVPLPSSPSSKFFVQLSTDFRFYNRAWPRGSSMAWRAQSTFRTSDGGDFHTVTAGNEHTIRGFYGNELGNNSRANNRLLFTAEYRIPMFRTPSMRLPGIATLVVPTREVYYRFDGTLFVDLAHLWPEIENTLTHDENAASIGAGVRMTAQPAKRAICFDLVPFVNYQGDWARTITDPHSWFWHLYVDLSF